MFDWVALCSFHSRRVTLRDMRNGENLMGVEAGENQKRKQERYGRQGILLERDPGWKGGVRWKIKLVWS